jgi:hypothetical protein
MTNDELTPRLEVYRERLAEITNLYTHSRAIEAKISVLQEQCRKDNEEFQQHVAISGVLAVKAVGGGGIYLIRPKPASIYTAPEPEFIPYP